jgi:hypothetical protein
MPVAPGYRPQTASPEAIIIWYDSREQQEDFLVPSPYPETVDKCFRSAKAVQIQMFQGSFLMPSP